MAILCSIGGGEGQGARAGRGKSTRELRRFHLTWGFLRLTKSRVTALSIAFFVRLCLFLLQRVSSLSTSVTYVQTSYIIPLISEFIICSLQYRYLWHQKGGSNIGSCTTFDDLHEQFRLPEQKESFGSDYLNTLKYNAMYLRRFVNIHIIGDVKRAHAEYTSVSCRVARLVSVCVPIRLAEWPSCAAGDNATSTSSYVHRGIF